ncbi:hypothetical protein M426DRAFT_15798 [Hypoxylon sp. CI-4A]|nr:hypothetical protein M426DRAFT_15798 [Hypoxylon sp. CI-4A]
MERYLVPKKRKLPSEYEVSDSESYSDSAGDSQMDEEMNDAGGGADNPLDHDYSDHDNSENDHSDLGDSDHGSLGEYNSNHDDNIAMLSDLNFTDDSAPDTDSESEDRRKAKNQPKGRLSADGKREWIIQSFNSLPAELQSVAKDQSRRIEKAADNSKAWIKKHRDAIESVQDILALIPSAESYLDERVWTRELEDEFQTQLQDDPHLRYLESSTLPITNTIFLAMWKKICRLRRRCPTDIISPLNYLEYGVGDPVLLENGSKAPNAIWNQGFCNRLTNLAIGGPWKNNMDLLALFVRYLAACRLL